MNMDVRAQAERAGASLQDAFLLLEVSSQLSRTHDVQAIARHVCSVARRLVGMDGTTLVLREREQVYYAEEEAPERLWRGRRFPAVQCISGWAILNRQTAVIEDIYTDPRIPIEAYRPTFVQSLAMVPMGREQPSGSIGAYWARRHKATEREVFLLESLAELAAAALSQARLHEEVERLRAQASCVEGASGSGGDPTLARIIPLVAHDLKNPLGAISLAAQALLRRGSLDEKDTGRVRRILASVERARHLVSEVLEYSRLQAGSGMPLDVVDARLDDITRSVVDEARTAFPGRKIDLIARDAAGRWDVHRVAEVLSNLLGNALQHGEPARPVTLSVGARHGECFVELHNFGPPIPEDVLPVLFEPFRQGRKGDRGSVGLGLFIVKQIVHAHGGRIRVRSTSEHGTTFSVHLPAHQSLPILPLREVAG